MNQVIKLKQGHQVFYIDLQQYLQLVARLDPNGESDDEYQLYKRYVFSKRKGAVLPVSYYTFLAMDYALKPYRNKKDNNYIEISKDESTNESILNRSWNLHNVRRHGETQKEKEETKEAAPAPAI